MKNIFKNIALVGLMIATTTSCDNYLDINEDPNNPTSSSITPDLMLAGVMTESYSPLATDANTLGNLMMQNWAGDITNYTGAFQTEFALTLTTTFYQDIWNDLYLYTASYSSIIDNENTDYTYYSAISKIMKVYYFQYLVDLYGDIPYTEAHKLGDNLTPIYDDDEVIYGDLLTQLNDAITLINSAPENALTVGSEDVIMGGDMDMWIKFANTLKLKILLRQEATGTYNSQFSSLSSANFITEDVTINPGYTDNTGKLNPFYGQFYQAGGSTNTYAILIVGAQYAVEFLKGNTTENGTATNVLDPRVGAIYEMEDDTYTGVQQGENDVPSGNGLSHLSTGVLSSADQDGYVMLAAESYLLQAEAIEKGYLSGNAATAFRQGITSSFTTFGLSSDDASTYIASSENVNQIGWTGSSSKIEAIMTQKWIALNSINAVESWIEYTRTGYPDVPLSTIAQKPSRPNRLLYPKSEYSSNAANVPEQAADDAFSTAIWWDVN